MVIDPIINDMTLAQVPGVGVARPAGGSRVLTGNAFEDVLSKAVDSLNAVSDTEFRANELINDYIAGRAELSDVMVATSKMSITVQLAVSVITTAVSTFKEITQMPM
jgi:flagellar hook-basal body complex protein FliE